MSWLTAKYNEAGQPTWGKHLIYLMEVLEEPWRRNLEGRNVEAPSECLWAFFFFCQTLKERSGVCWLATIIGVVGAMCGWLLDMFPSKLGGVPPNQADVNRLMLCFVGFGRTNPYTRFLLVVETFVSCLLPFKEPVRGFVYWRFHPWEILEWWEPCVDDI